MDAARRPKKSASEMEDESEREQAPKEEEPLYCGYSPLAYKQHEKGLLRTQVPPPSLTLRFISFFS